MCWAAKANIHGKGGWAAPFQKHNFEAAPDASSPNGTLSETGTALELSILILVPLQVKLARASTVTSISARTTPSPIKPFRGGWIAGLVYLDYIKLILTRQLVRFSLHLYPVPPTMFTLQASIRAQKCLWLLASLILSVRRCSRCCPDDAL
jgi:hypothetical protein